MYGWMDGWMDVCMYVCIWACTAFLAKEPSLRRMVRYLLTLVCLFADMVIAMNATLMDCDLGFRFQGLGGFGVCLV